MKPRITQKLLLYKVQTHRDQDAYAQLYDLYVEKIYRFILFKISNREEAEDLTSEVFLKTWQYLVSEDSRPTRSFSGLIYRIARNAVIDVYRDRAKRPEQSIEHISEADLAQKESFTELIHIQQDAERLLELIGQLKDSYQEIILMRYIEELTIAEIAETLQKKKTAVRVTLHRALNVLKRMSEEQGK